MSLRSLAFGKGLRLLFEPVDDDIEARVDRRAFANAVRDLIVSAIKRTDDGEIRVSISTDRPNGSTWITVRVSISGTRPAGQMQFPWPELNGSRQLAESLGGSVEMQVESITNGSLTLLLPAN